MSRVSYAPGARSVQLMFILINGWELHAWTARITAMEVRVWFERVCIAHKKSTKWTPITSTQFCTFESALATWLSLRIPALDPWFCAPDFRLVCP